jgi:GT2 family glycosyltransferase
MGDAPGWPAATVVLLLHKPGARELQTLSLIAGQDYPSTFNIMAIDSTPEALRGDVSAFRAGAHQWETIPPGSFGHGATRNLAVSMCQTPVVVYLSQDAHPQSRHWLQSLVRPLAEGRAEASYGRQVAPSQVGEREATFGYLYPEAAEVKTKESIKHLGLRTFHFSDVTSAFKTDVIRKVGFPTHLPTFEDVGVAKRFLDAGLRLAYVPEAVVQHAHPLSFKEMALRYRQIGMIYEQLGIFEELKRSGRPLLTEGLRVGRRVSQSSRGGLRGKATSAAMGVIKLGAVAWGRRQGRQAQVSKPAILEGP